MGLITRFTWKSVSRARRDVSGVCYPCETAGLSRELFCFWGYVSVFARLSDNLILCRAVFKPVFGFCWRKTAGKKYHKCCQYLSCFSKTTLEELESNYFLLKILYIETRFSASFQGNICHFHLVYFFILKVTLF